MGAGQDAAQADSPPAPVPPGGAAGRWLRRTALGAGLCALTAVAASVALVWPYVRDDLVLDRVVLAVALDWRDFGRDKAQARLQYELDHRGIGMQVTDEHCALEEPEPEVRRVACRWTADVRLPLLEWTVPLGFASQAEVGPDGSLRRL